MKFNNKWDVLPDKEVNNREKGGSACIGGKRTPAKLACLEKWPVERGRQARGKRRGREAEERESR